MAPPTEDELLTVIRQYYPSSLSAYDDVYEASPEILRRYRKIVEVGQNPSWWREIVEQLDRRSGRGPVRSVGILVHDAAWRVRIPLRDGASLPALTVCFSIFGPYWTAYASLPKGDPRANSEREPWRPHLEPPEEALANEVAARVEALRGAVLERVSAPLLMTTVPDLTTGHVELGRARIMDLLFTDERW